MDKHSSEIVHMESRTNEKCHIPTSQTKGHARRSQAKERSGPMIAVHDDHHVKVNVTHVDQQEKKQTKKERAVVVPYGMNSRLLALSKPRKVREKKKVEKGQTRWK
eukprot:gnl/Carplike_NY0171/5800_a7950_212.p1 GENE.gnl/Carplike_NY0171/5800_a7950_212~~gnl/Carplike_NY0171/5800_a7950_212.p1  ORF type:complete len:106 (+),score=21.91 gnl/Carplike_NY0171/5800_a7950_212:404-721(+)